MKQQKRLIISILVFTILIISSLEVLAEGWYSPDGSSAGCKWYATGQPVNWKSCAPMCCLSGDVNPPQYDRSKSPYCKETSYLKEADLSCPGATESGACIMKSNCKGCCLDPLKADNYCADNSYIVWCWGPFQTGACNDVSECKPENKVCCINWEQECTDTPEYEKLCGQFGGQFNGGVVPNSKGVSACQSLPACTDQCCYINGVLQSSLKNQMACEYECNQYPDCIAAKAFKTAPASNIQSCPTQVTGCCVVYDTGASDARKIGDNVDMSTCLQSMGDSNCYFFNTGTCPSLGSIPYSAQGVCKQEVPVCEQGLMVHDFKLSRRGTTYTLYMDGMEVASSTSPDIPDKIFIGNDVIVDSAHLGDWSAFRFDYVKVEAGSAVKFEDQFSTVDASKWTITYSPDSLSPKPECVALKNSEVTSSNSWIVFKKEMDLVKECTGYVFSGSFPVATSKVNPFPTTGDFDLTFRMDYLWVTGFGIRFDVLKGNLPILSIMNKEDALSSTRGTTGLQIFLTGKGEVFKTGCSGLTPGVRCNFADTSSLSNESKSCVSYLCSKGLLQVQPVNNVVNFNPAGSLASQDFEKMTQGLSSTGITDSLARKQLAEKAVSIVGLPADQTIIPSPFTDVPADNPFYTKIYTASQCTVMRPTSGLFVPDRTATREEGALAACSIVKGDAKNACGVCVNGYKGELCAKQQGVCAGTTKTCTNNKYPECSFATYKAANAAYEEPSEARCADGVDNDCNGKADGQDANCVCTTPGQTRACGSGIGECRQGTQTCGATFVWGDCIGAVGPAPETCTDRKDNDCDTFIDYADTDCPIRPPVCDIKETCNDFMDNDCDNFFDCNDPDCYQSAVCKQGDCVDLDNDGYGYGPDCIAFDCDDNNPSIQNCSQAALGIKLINPWFNISNSLTFQLAVQTSRDADCRYSTPFSKTYDSMTDQLQSTSNRMHIKEGFTLPVENTYYSLYISCKEPNNQVTTKSFLIKADLTDPRINLAEAIPELISELPFETTLVLETSEKTICRFDEQAVDYTDMNFAFTSFNDYDIAAYNSRVEKKLTSLEDKKDYSYTVLCKDLSGRISGPSVITFRVDSSAEPEITGVAPRNNSFVSNATIKLEARTNKRSTCTYGTTETPTTATGSFSREGVYHVSEPIVLKQGKYTYYFTCLFSGPVYKSASTRFTVDLTPPTTPLVDDSSNLEGVNKEFTYLTDRLYATWKSTDADSGISYYQYAIIVSSNSSNATIIKDWTTTTEERLWITGLELTNKTKYAVQVKAANKAGLFSQLGRSDGITVDTTKEPAPCAITCGGSCPKCQEGRKCSINADCLSGICSSNKSCAAPTCTDKIKNGNETDTDCGGAFCTACPTGKHCEGNNDCEPGLRCKEGACEKKTIDKFGLGEDCNLDTECYSELCQDGICALLDTDEDGISDDKDNCPEVYNPEQTDTDGDGIGDACQTAGDVDVDVDVNGGTGGGFPWWLLMIILIILVILGYFGYTYYTKQSKKTTRQTTTTTAQPTTPFQQTIRPAQPRQPIPINPRLAELIRRQKEKAKAAERQQVFESFNAAQKPAAEEKKPITPEEHKELSSQITALAQTTPSTAQKTEAAAEKKPAKELKQPKPVDVFKELGRVTSAGMKKYGDKRGTIFDHLSSFLQGKVKPEIIEKLTAVSKARAVSKEELMSVFEDMSQGNKISPDIPKDVLKYLTSKKKMPKTEAYAFLKDLSAAGTITSSEADKIKTSLAKK